ncbi:hypothetical protein T06_5781, partial [Trichinella sp. T6]
LTYVASGSVVKRSLNMNNEEKKKRKRVIRRASRSRTTRNGSRTARSRTRKDKRYMRFPVGPNSVSLG